MARLGLPHADPTAAGARAPAPPPPAPLLLPVLGLMLGIWLSAILGTVPVPVRLSAWALVSATLLLMLCLRRLRAGAGRSAALLVAGAAAVGFARHQATLDLPPFHIRHALGCEPVLTRLAGTVVTEPVERPPIKHNPFLPFEPPPRTHFVLAVDQLLTSHPPRPIAGQVRVTIGAVGLDLRLGQRVYVAGQLYPTPGPRNPGDFDRQRWDRQQGVDASLSVESAAHIEQPPGDPPWHLRLRAAARATARSLLFEPQARIEPDECVRLLDTMVLGQRRAADQKLNEAFLRAGGMHFLAVSGFHVAILAGAAWWLVRRIIGAGRRAAALATSLLSLTYALVAEPNAPILRATIGIMLVVSATLVNRPVCALNWLAFAAGCILLWKPNELFGAGFQLSFIQVLALLTIVGGAVRTLLSQKRDRWAVEPAGDLPLLRLVGSRVTRGLAALALVCAGAWAISLPLTLWHFGQWAPWGWLGAILLTPLVAAVTLLSLVTMGANVVLPPVGALLSTALQAATDGLLGAAELFEHLPGTVIESQRPPLWLVAASYALPLGLYAWGSARQRSAARGQPQRALVRPTTLAVALATAGLILAWGAWIVLPAHAPGADYTLHALAVGSGSAAVLTTPDRQAVVLDVGTDGNFDAGETVARALRALSVRRVEAVLISHANFDHFSGLPALLRRWPVRRWLTNPHYLAYGDTLKGPAHLAARLPPSSPAPRALHTGDLLRFGAAQLEVLWPPDDLPLTWRINDTSLVVRLTIGGRRVLLTGDIEQRALMALVDAARTGEVDLRADVLVAPHHGQVIDARSATANFYRAVAPRFVIASTRQPRPKLSRLLASLDPEIRLLETATVGAVSVRASTAGALRVETPWATVP